MFILNFYFMECLFHFSNFPLIPIDVNFFSGLLGKSSEETFTRLNRKNHSKNHF